MNKDFDIRTGNNMIKSLSLCALLAIFVPLSVFAEEIIYSNNSPKYECFDKDGLSVIQQEVNDGHQPWRIDPVYYAKHFMNSYYSNLDCNDRERLPAELIMKNRKTSVKIAFDCKEFASHPIIDTKWDTLTDGFKRKCNQAIVKVAYNGKTHTVYLHKAFPANVESIWVVEKMAINKGH